MGKHTTLSSQFSLYIKYTVAYFWANTCIPCFGSFQWPILPVPTPSSTTNLSGNLSYLPKNFDTAYVQQFNLMLQQQFGSNVFTIGGIGELGAAPTLPV